jgi:hypothetical protein
MFTFADLWTVARAMLALLGVVVLAAHPWLLIAGIATMAAICGGAWYRTSR